MLNNVLIFFRLKVYFFPNVQTFYLQEIGGGELDGLPIYVCVLEHY